MLLEHCNSQNIQQAVLQAISEDHTSIAELMLKHPCFIEICRKRKRLGDTDGFFKTEVESQFSTDMTPLNLAAQKNNYAIVQLLLQRGETIQNVGSAQRVWVGWLTVCFRRPFNLWDRFKMSFLSQFTG